MISVLLEGVGCPQSIGSQLIFGFLVSLNKNLRYAKEDKR